MKRRPGSGLRALAILATLALGAGCAGRAPTPGPEGAESAGGPRGSRAVATLTAEARRAQANGRQDVAAAKIERALRLEPRDAALWHRLAVIRLAQGRPRQAETLARKSLTLTDRDTLKADNWRLIADARRRAGDPDGARRAESRISGEPEDAR